MVIGIDASRAFLKRRTGIEEYAYQTIKHLRDVVPSTDQVILYVRRKIEWQKGRIILNYPEIDFSLPSHWRVRGIWAPRFWTQIGLSLEMLWKAPGVLFIPAHTVPLIHPKRTVVTIHGLEYEFCPQAYSFWDRLYMRSSIRFSCQAAESIIAVSENTKHDLMRLYSAPQEKISVIYEGYEQGKNRTRPYTLNQKPYLLFIGRLEERKNIIRIIEAFESLKKEHDIPHQLVLVGKPGYGYEKIQTKLSRSSYRSEIHEKGYIGEEEKWSLLGGAEVFLFPTLYEGFGIPILEAQSVGIPVVTSNTSSLPEVAGEGAVFVDPKSSESIAQGIQKVLFDRDFRDGIIVKATQNVSRFSWAQCANGIGQKLLR